MKNIFKELIDKLSYFYLFKFDKKSDQSTIYDNLIKNTLRTNTIPFSKGIYYLNAESKEFVIDEQDIDTFYQLFYVTPPKKGKVEGLNRSIGNGEVAIYWLFKYQNVKNKVISSLKPSSYDLSVGDNDIEIKDSNNPSGKIKYGRFGSDKISLKILNIIFSLYTLFSPIDLNESDDKVVNTTNFSGTDLLEVFDKIFWIIYSYDIQDKDTFIQDKIKLLLDYLDHPANHIEATRRFLLKLITTKLTSKPGNNNFVLNVNENGVVTVFFVDFRRLVSISDTDLFSSVEVGQSAIHLNLKNLFG